MIQKLLFALIFAGALAAGCNSKKDPGKESEQEILKLNNLYDSAIVHQDTGAIKRLLADDYVYTNPDGKVLNKEQQLISLAASEMKWDSGKSEDVKVKVYNNLAVMTGAFFARGNYRGNPLSISERYTTVWIKIDETWKMVAEQGNVIK